MATKKAPPVDAVVATTGDAKLANDLLRLRALPRVRQWVRSRSVPH